jgi:hypothetical protein
MMSADSLRAQRLQARVDTMTQMEWVQPRPATLNAAQP